ncbi:MAG TPA: hypothetical protein VMB27_15670 [Solirubrobacteraceae bacterium]|nr:hypothetical protein [Solirubrobacteraceae bacterium]
MDGGLGADCGGWFGDCSPSELGFAAGGNCGIAVDDDLAPVAVVVPRGDFEASDRPGATADTSAAKPAVSAAVAAITHRRVRPIRAIAASRASAARDLSSRLVIRRSSPIMTAQGISAQ